MGRGGCGAQPDLWQTQVSNWWGRLGSGGQPNRPGSRRSGLLSVRGLQDAPECAGPGIQLRRGFRRCPPSSPELWGRKMGSQKALLGEDRRSRTQFPDGDGRGPGPQGTQDPQAFKGIKEPSARAGHRGAPGAGTLLGAAPGCGVSSQGLHSFCSDTGRGGSSGQLWAFQEPGPQVRPTESSL